MAVSTCYVAGNRRGAAPEIPVAREPVLRRRRLAHARSTAPAGPAPTPRPTAAAPTPSPRFRKEARNELGAAGIPPLAAKTEQRRAAWVKDQMVEAGRARAASLGWPDAYAYTKALGERALLQNRGDVPVSIVRPSIIESAVLEPVPGWIRGFRMAEPVIISYARGLLKEFPGVPEGTVDVIPVDLVVAAIIDVAAGPDPRRSPTSPRSPPARSTRCATGTSSTWCASGSPSTRSTTPRASRSSCPSGRSPAAGRVQRQLERAKSVIERAEKVLQSLPLRGKQAEWAATLEEKREEVERALAYVELYGAYAECEAIYGVDHLLARWDRLDPEDQATFCFDPRVIDWNHYAPQHPPAVGGRARPGAHHARRPRRARSARTACAARCSTPTATSPPSTSRTPSSRRTWWPPTPGWPPAACPQEDRVRFVLQTLREAPGAACRSTARDRSDFLRHFYRRYEGADVAQLEADAAEMFSDLILTKSFPAAIRRVREHRRLGHRTVLITGALDFVVEPLRPLFDDIVAPSLARRADGTYRGELHRRAAHRRGPGLGAVRLRRRSTASTWPRPSPTPTPPPTCRCSRPSASRWPSTPRPAWPRWPASGAGWSSTSTRPPGSTQPAPAPIGPRVGPTRGSRRVGKVATDGRPR